MDQNSHTAFFNIDRLEFFDFVLGIDINLNKKNISRVHFLVDKKNIIIKLNFMFIL